MPTPPGIKLSTNARLWWDAAESEARARGHVKISTEHLLWALCSEGACPATRASYRRMWAFHQDMPLQGSLVPLYMKMRLLSADRAALLAAM